MNYISIIIKFYNFLFSKLNTVRFYIVEKLLYEISKKKIKKLIKVKNPLISIVLPTYNREKMLKERSIPSVLAQTYKNFQLIIVSDGSTDNTEQTIKDFKDERIDFFKIEREKNRYLKTPENHWLAGPVKAINYGLHKIKGEWIARIDDDDIWTEDHLEVLLNFAIENKYEFVSSANIEYRYGKKIRYNHLDQKPRVGGVQSWLYAGYLKFFKSNINCWRKSWNKVNDMDLLDRMCKVGINKGYIDQVTVILKPRHEDKTIGYDAIKDNPEFYSKKYD